MCIFLKWPVSSKLSNLWSILYYHFHDCGTSSNAISFIFDTGDSCFPIYSLLAWLGVTFLQTFDAVLTRRLCETLCVCSFHLHNSFMGQLFLLLFYRGRNREPNPFFLSFFFCNKGEQYHRYPLCLKVVFGYLPTSSLLIGMVTCTTLAVKSQRRRSFNGNKTKWLNVGKALPFTSIVIKMEGVSLGLYFISRC